MKDIEELNGIFLNEILEFYPQKILNWLKSYNISFRIFRKIKDYKEIQTYESGLPIIRKREYFTMNIENYLDDIEFDSVNQCIFTIFLMWSGKNYEHIKLISDEINNK